jgi:hypothetical protein
VSDREQNRARMPTLAGEIDKFRALVGPGLRVPYATESGHELGSRERHDADGRLIEELQRLGRVES